MSKKTIKSHPDGVKVACEREASRKTRSIWWQVAAVVLLVCAAWANSFGVPFVLDDVHSVTANPSIRNFGALDWLKPPSGIGETVGGRPFLNFTLAVDYSLHGPSAAWFHVTNLLVHLASALAVLGVAGRLSRQVWQGDERHAARFAFAVALIWAVHPLQTSAVTYVSQRAESLAGFFVLTGFYAYLLSLDGTRRGLWTAVSVAAALLGAMTKETAVALPALVALHSWVRSADDSVRRKVKSLPLFGGYLAVWVCWLVFAGGDFRRGGSTGWETEVGVGDYLLTQCQAIGHYLRQAVWPDSLVFDFGNVVAGSLAEVWVQALLIAVVLGGALWGVAKRQPWGFALAAFFALLAPSSSIVPVATQTIAEHRMYLPLLVPVAFAVAAWIMVENRLPRWVSPVVLLVVAVALATATQRRNALYHSAVDLWGDTVEKAPRNARAFNNLGVSLLEAGRLTEAEAAFRRAVELRPNHAFARYNLGTVRLREGRWEQSVEAFRGALSADPQLADAQLGLGLALARLDRKQEAIFAFEESIRIDPAQTDAAMQLAVLRRESGREEEALVLLRGAVAQSPDLAEARYELAITLERSGALAAARQEMSVVVELRPEWAAARLALGNILMRQSEASAEVEYREAVRLDPRLAEARYALGGALVRREAYADAMAEFRAAITLAPDHVKAWANLGNCLLVTGNVEEAIGCYDQVLRRTPEDAAVRQNREVAKEFLRTNSLQR